MLVKWRISFQLSKVEFGLFFLIYYIFSAKLILFLLEVTIYLLEVFFDSREREVGLERGDYYMLLSPLFKIEGSLIILFKLSLLF